MKEYKNILEGRTFSEKISDAQLGFERLARRLDELWQKDKLTPEENEEVELILNNAAHVQEMLETREKE